RREATPAASGTVAEPAAPAIARERLERLGATASAPASPETEPAPEHNADLQAAKEAANAKLSDLVGKK
ncbi:MAG: hypothetical protein PHC30_05910, partial [Lentisphaeria bacterium]|nr:hypothetical protein [Lentisphaeria bacterium]